MNTRKRTDQKASKTSKISKLSKISGAISLTTSEKIEALGAAILGILGENSIPIIYRDQIRSDRTRRYELPPPFKGGSVPEVEIMHTLLGVELKVGRRRLACPDLSTARYLAVFARLGVAAVALPYDITRVAIVADQLESAWYKMIRLIESETDGLGDDIQKRLLRSLVLRQREEVDLVGPGPVAPQFNRR